jgi:sacsin
MRDLLRQLPVWPAIDSLKWVTANTALANRNHRLLITWMLDYDRFIKPHFVADNSYALEQLGVYEIAEERLIREYILPELPQRVPKPSMISYGSLITSISQVEDIDNVLNMLRARKLAPDRNGKMHMACELYDHEDQIF